MNNKIYVCIPAIALLSGCELSIFNSGFDFNSVNDKIDGQIITSQKQFTEDKSILIAQAKFTCFPQKKKILFELGSFQVNSGGDKKILPPSPFLLAGNSAPDGVVKFGVNEPISFAAIRDMKLISHSNVITWDIEEARLKANWQSSIHDIIDAKLELESIYGKNKDVAKYLQLKSRIEDSKKNFELFEQKTNAEIASLTDKEMIEAKKLEIASFRQNLGLEQLEREEAELNPKASGDAAKVEALQDLVKKNAITAAGKWKNLFAFEQSQPKISTGKSPELDALANLFGANYKFTDSDYLEMSNKAAGIVLTNSPETKKYIKIISGSDSDSGLISKLGSPVSFRYKSQNGEFTFSIDFEDKNLKKLIASCS